MESICINKIDNHLCKVHTHKADIETERKLMPNILKNFKSALNSNKQNSLEVGPLEFTNQEKI